jgi:hypothetical protein
MFLKRHLLRRNTDKMICQPMLIFQKFLHFMFFLAICLKKDRSKETFPVRVRVKGLQTGILFITGVG